MPETEHRGEFWGDLTFIVTCAIMKTHSGVPLLSSEIERAALPGLTVDQISSFGPGVALRVFSFFVKE